MLEAHHDTIRAQLSAYRGREVKTTGDGFLVLFESPAMAVRCARAARDAVRRAGIEIRIGLHAGECEVTGDDVAGIAVHAAARVQSAAGPGQVLVSQTVRDLTAGSGLGYVDADIRHLKGFEEPWRLFEAVG